MSLSQTQYNIHFWLRKNWKDKHTIDELLKLLKKEVDDLVALSTDKESIDDQLAACVLTLCTIAQLKDVNLQELTTKRYMSKILKLPPWVYDGLNTLAEKKHEVKS